MVSAKGCYYTDNHGKQIFDGLSGLGAVAGHGPHGDHDAVTRQMARSTTPPHSSSATRCRSSWQQAQGTHACRLDYVFFTGSGSESADTSLKMARAYWRAKAKPARRADRARKRLPGVNFGASRSRIVANRKMFARASRRINLPHTQLPERLFTRHADRASSWRTTCCGHRLHEREQYCRRDRGAFSARPGGDSPRATWRPARHLHANNIRDF